MDGEMTDEFLVVNDIRTHVLRAGNGKLLLLVHGLGAPQMWQRVIEPLSKFFQVVIVDLPGFGESDCPRDPYTPSDYAGHLAKLLEMLRSSAPNIVGISYGGQIAATYAALFPERIGSLVLVVSTGLRKPRWIARHRMPWRTAAVAMRETVLKSEKMLELLSRRSYFDIRNRPGNFVRTFMKPFAQRRKRDAWLNALRNVLSPEPEFAGRLNRIHCPTLIVWGANDRSVPVVHAHELHALIPDSQLTILDNCAHSVPLEKPHELTEAIRQFVGGGHE